MNTIFAVNIENFAAFFEEGLYLIHRAKQQEVLRFKQEKDRHRKLVSALLLRILVKRFLYLSEYNVSTNAYGKPYLERFPEFQFNISHSGNWVVAAVSDKPLGIDIEQINELHDFMDIAKRFYSEKEYAALTECEEKPRLDLFYEIWAKKESLIKAVGKGLSIPLKSFTVSFKPNSLIEYNDVCWSLFMPEFRDEHYKVAVCSFYSENFFAQIKPLALSELI